MRRTSVRGAVAGAAATVVITLEQRLDRRVFVYKYDDVDILGKLVTRGDYWEPQNSSWQRFTPSQTVTRSSLRQSLADSSRPPFATTPQRSVPPQGSTS